jgi:hypothetical protein
VFKLEKSQAPIRVGIVTVDPLVVREAMHLLYDGVVASNYLTLVGSISLYGGLNNTHPETLLQPADAQVWLVDGARKLKREFTTRLLEEEASNAVFFDWSGGRFHFQLRNYHQHTTCGTTRMCDWRYDSLFKVGILMAPIS